MIYTKEEILIINKNIISNILKKYNKDIKYNIYDREFLQCKEITFEDNIITKNNVIIYKKTNIIYKIIIDIEYNNIIYSIFIDSKNNYSILKEYYRNLLYINLDISKYIIYEIL